MLTEEVKKVERSGKTREVTTITGCCRFCGQVTTAKGLKSWEQEQTDELITENCGCEDAKLYAYKKGQKERSKEMTEIESIIKRLTESNKVLAASAPREKWRINRVFSAVKEVFPEAKLYNCIGLIFLIARKEHKESLKKYLEKKHAELTKYSEWQRSKNWENGDKEEVERNIKEIEETLKELERE